MTPTLTESKQAVEPGKRWVARMRACRPLKVIGANGEFIMQAGDHFCIGPYSSAERAEQGAESLKRDHGFEALFVEYLGAYPEGQSP
jgi:hypothetical protein